MSGQLFLAVGKQKQICVLIYEVLGGSFHSGAPVVFFGTYIPEFLMAKV
jgi:hypothetical protein